MNLPLYIVAASLTIAAYGQSSDINSSPVNVAPTGKPRQEIEVQAPRAPKTTEVTTNALSKVQPDQPTKPKVTYSGVGHDVRKSTNRWKMFSLRRRADLQEDDKAVIRNLRTEGGGAVKLFSVDF
ncbi:MAG TPA: hypothetical protein VM680_08575 [Verrucomicrobiae bacterium]|nr:hypothetical protein [Verrucomicrobiae bacterium]